MSEILKKLSIDGSPHVSNLNIATLIIVCPLHVLNIEKLSIDGSPPVSNCTVVEEEQCRTFEEMQCATVLVRKTKITNPPKNRTNLNVCNPPL